MDRYKSLELEKTLRDKLIAGYKVIELINNGKSAAVFKAERDGHYYALKIFDNEMIERFGHEIQTIRIEQEISLKNHTIDNLVKIFEGGNTLLLDQKYYYIVMELIEGKNLKDFINDNNYGQDFIINVLKKLMISTEQLLSQKNIVHRDIKPENIMVNQNNDIILMDLGVLKFIGAASLSDEDEVSFVGTLRYAPPEFLTRNEENTINGWKSVNLYQIGATLHDLIMKSELFRDEQPYSKLVLAIYNTNPSISNPNFSYELIQLARNMLSKDWKRRLEIVTEEKLRNVYSIIESENDDFQNSYNELMKLREKPQALNEEIESLKRTKQEKEERKREIGKNLYNVISNCFGELKKLNVFKTYSHSQGNFHLNNQDRTNTGLVQNVIYDLKGDLTMGYPKPLYILVRLMNDDNGFCQVNATAFFPYISTNTTILEPIGFLENVFDNRNKMTLRSQINRSNPHLHNNEFNINMIVFFDGIVEFDNDFDKLLLNKFIKLITMSLKKVNHLVEEKLKKEKDYVENNRRSSVEFVDRNSIIIDSLD